MRHWLRLGMLLLLAAGTLCAHDTWLVPESFRVQAGRPLKVALNTSEDFPTSEAAAGPERIARFEVVSVAGRSQVTGYRVEGKSLVAEVTPGQGVTLVAAVTRPRLIVLEPEDFNNYITEEHLDDIVAARAARRETQAEGRERYSKIAKLALCTGYTHRTIFREPLGLPLEIVPWTNPCRLRAGDKLRGTLHVRVLFEGNPLADVWVVAGYTGVHGHDYPIWVKTDSKGQASIRIDRPGAWFVRVLHMVPSAKFDDADWQSWFSTLTFSVE